ncbi:hypothetical protein BLNAU_12492 [Blattamonas nauphoetae]|uniref:Uncharacterized protein n=1 Tax=Blattamonas nauphoetae TaxID=2049346 RepID=A0ABQ9XPJ1_9EUKA|nr:hypothetical protein BLNAU_12492 [Blattamonas nauphoetae]
MNLMSAHRSYSRNRSMGWIPRAAKNSPQLASCVFHSHHSNPSVELFGVAFHSLVSFLASACQIIMSLQMSFNTSHSDISSLLRQLSLFHPPTSLPVSLQLFLISQQHPSEQNSMGFSSSCLYQSWNIHKDGRGCFGTPVRIHTHHKVMPNSSSSSQTTLRHHEAISTISQTILSSLFESGVMHHSFHSSLGRPILQQYSLKDVFSVSRMQ